MRRTLIAKLKQLYFKNPNWIDINPEPFTIKLYTFYPVAKYIKSKDKRTVTTYAYHDQNKSLKNPSVLSGLDVDFVTIKCGTLYSLTIEYSRTTAILSVTMEIRPNIDCDTNLTRQEIAFGHELCDIQPHKSNWLIVYYVIQ